MATKESVSNHWRSVYRNYLDNPKRHRAWRIKAVCYSPWPLLFNRVTLFFERFFSRRVIKDLNYSLSNKRVLDIGCGTGRWTHFFGEYGSKVIGIDLFSDLLIDNKRQFPNHSFCVMSAVALALKSESVDFVSAAIVLQHIPRSQKEEAFKEICRVLKPEGRCLIIEAVGLTEGNHFVLWTDDQWEALFAKQGLHLSLKRALHAYPLAALYKKIVSLIAGIIKKIKSPLKTRRKEFSFSETNIPAQPTSSEMPKLRHRIYRVLDQNLLRIIAIISFPIEFIWLGLGGKGSHRMYILEKRKSTRHA